MPPNDHALYGPSGASIWLNCPASVRRTQIHEAKYGKQPDTTASLAGKAAHDEAERVLHDRIEPDPKSPHYTHVANYTKHVRDIIFTIQEFGEAPSISIENRIETGIPDCWGTADIVISARTEAWIGDLKAGQGLVDAEENDQMLTYAVGVRLDNPRLTKFNFFIAQAADIANPIKSWSCDAEVVDEHARKIKTAVMRADLDYPPLIGDHCTWCKGKGSCEAQNALSTSVFDTANAVEVTALTDAQRIFIIDNAPFIKKYMDAVIATALRSPPAGRKVVAGKGRRKWIDDDDTVLSVLSNYDIGGRVSPVPIGEATKILVSKLGKAQAAAAIEDITITSPGKPTLALTSDPRPALDAGALVFNDEESSDA